MTGMNSGNGYSVRNECMANLTLKSGTRKGTVQNGNLFEEGEEMYQVCRAFFCRVVVRMKKEWAAF